MKRAVVAAGAFALVATGLYGASVTDALTAQEKNKRWLLSGSLRNFFDDNMFNEPAWSEESSFGVEVSPGIAFNLPLERSLILASYEYRTKFFEARKSHKYDQYHELEGKFTHKFSERYDLAVTENFVMSDEPIVSGPQSVIRSREDASNQRNTFGADFSILTKPTFGWQVSYSTYWQDYKDLSYATLLDHFRQSIHIDARWFQTESTLYYVGYAFGLTDYTYPEYLQVGTAEFIRPSEKDNLVHRAYFGARYERSRRLELSGRLGLDYTDYFNADDSNISPYFDFSAKYTYYPESFIRLGANVERYPADVVGVLDQLIASASVGVSHRLAARTTLGLDLKYQRQIFNDRSNDGSADASGSDDIYTIALSAEYKIRENFFATFFYARNQRVSGRSFADAIDYTRNEVYWGMRASY